MRLLLAALLPAVALAAPRLADAVVAVVDQSTLTLSDVDLETRVTLINAGGLDAATAPLDGRALAAGLEQVIDEELLAADADRLHVPAPEPQVLEQALARFAGKFAGPDAFRAFLRVQDVSEADLQALLSRDLRAQAYLEGRFKLAATARDADIDAFLKAHADAAKGRSPAVAREAARTQLTQERYLKLTRDLLGELRRRADVRVIEDLRAELP